MAQAELPVQNSGKLKEGQNVNIRLDSYPFEEYGIIQGKIATVSILPSGGNYFVKISLPNGLITSHHREIEFKQKLSGSTEIITEDLKLFERFFYQVRKHLNGEY